MTATLTISVPPTAAAGGAPVGLFGPALLAMWHLQNRPRPNPAGGALAGLLHDGLVRGLTVTERELRRAVAAELTVRHGARIDHLALLGYSGPFIAVAFDATVVAVPRRADPVDILTPWQGVTRDQVDALELLGGTLGRMLGALAGDGMRRPGDRWELGRVVDELRELRMFTADFGQHAALWTRVLAANIELCVNGAERAHVATARSL